MFSGFELYSRWMPLTNDLTLQRSARRGMQGFFAITEIMPK